MDQACYLALARSHHVRGRRERGTEQQGNRLIFRRYSPGRTGRSLTRASGTAATVLLALALLQACVGVEDARRLGPPAGPFNEELYHGYLMLAEKTEDRPFTASVFAYKAKAAARGELIQPERIDDWLATDDLPTHWLVGRARLSTALVESQRRSRWLAAARAQVHFDCWLVASGSGGFSALADHCRDVFREALDLVERGLAREGRTPEWGSR